LDFVAQADSAEMPEVAASYAAPPLLKRYPRADLHHRVCLPD